MSQIMNCSCILSVSTVFLALIFQAASDSHHRQKRFVFYPGSVLQLAAGLAIPAEVPNKIIYTNYGIMINYDLPTNLSSLSPLTFVEDARATSSLAQMSMALFQKFGLKRSCLNVLKRFVEHNDNHSSLKYHVARVFLSGVFEALDELYPTGKTQKYCGWGIPLF